MVQVAGLARAGQQIRSSLLRMGMMAAAVVLGFTAFYVGCTARVRPNELGVEQHRLGSQKGIVSRAFGPGLYFVGPGTAMHTFPREIHVLEASYDRKEARILAALARAQAQEKDAANAPIVAANPTK